MSDKIVHAYQQERGVPCGALDWARDVDYETNPRLITCPACRQIIMDAWGIIPAKLPEGWKVPEGYRVEVRPAKAGEKFWTSAGISTAITDWNPLNIIFVLVPLAKPESDWKARAEVAEAQLARMREAVKA